MYKLALQGDFVPVTVVVYFPCVSSAQQERQIELSLHNLVNVSTRRPFVSGHDSSSFLILRDLLAHDTASSYHVNSNSCIDRTPQDQFIVDGSSAPGPNDVLFSRLVHAHRNLPSWTTVKTASREILSTQQMYAEGDDSGRRTSE
jgi:hypothetical protein